MEKLYSRPPSLSSGKTPDQILNPKDMSLLARHYKDYSVRKGKAVETKSDLSEGELSIVATLYSMLREEYGFYPEGLSNGKLMWGTALKSDIQMLMEKHGDEYEKLGEAIRENPGELGRIVEGRRIA